MHTRSVRGLAHAADRLGVSFLCNPSEKHLGHCHGERIPIAFRFSFDHSDNAIVGRLLIMQSRKAKASKPKK
jgi:hypothetical protein